MAVLGPHQIKHAVGHHGVHTVTFHQRRTLAQLCRGFVGRQQLFAEVHRVLKRGGRAIISDIVSDEDVPEICRTTPNYGAAASAARFVKIGFWKRLKKPGSMAWKLSTGRKRHGQWLTGLSFAA